jgi:hypothetical protein
MQPTADAGSNWHLLGFEGELEGEKLQAIDQVHLNKDGRIDHVIIYMRPIPVAQKFAEAIMQRLQARLRRHRYRTGGRRGILALIDCDQSFTRCVANLKGAKIVIRKLPFPLTALNSISLLAVQQQGVRQCFAVCYGCLLRLFFLIADNLCSANSW